MPTRERKLISSITGTIEVTKPLMIDSSLEIPQNMVMTFASRSGTKSAGAASCVTGSGFA